MATVGEATIKLNFDGKSLEASMDKTQKTVEEKGGELGKAGGQKASAMWGIGIGAIAGITQAVITQALDLITSGIDSAIKRVDTMNNFPRVMENLGISAEKSDKVIKDLGERLKGLPTTLDAAALSVQRFTSANDNIEKSEEYFLALNNALLAGGASMDIQQTALEQLSQAYAKGKPDMMEWRSLMTAMPAQLKQVAKAMNYVSTDELGEALRSGEVSMDKFMDTMVMMNKKGAKGYKSFEAQAKSATGGIQTAQANLGTAIARGWANILNTIGSKKMTAAIAKVGEILEGILNKVAEILAKISSNQAVMQALSTILTIIGGLLAAIGWTIGNVLLPIIETVLTVLATGFNFVIGIIGGFIEAIQSAGKWFHDVFVGISVALGNFSAQALKVVDGFRNAFLNAINSVKSWFGGLFNFFSGIASKIGNLFKNIGTTVGKMVSGAFKGMVNAVIGAAENFLNTPIRAINSLLDVINAVPGVEVGYLTPLSFPRLAKGGVATGSTIANIGEAGKEAVIPLERNTENWARPLASAIADQFQEQGIGGAGITVYMTNNINNNLDADEIGRRLMTSIRRAA